MTRKIPLDGVDLEHLKQVVGQQLRDDEHGLAPEENFFRVLGICDLAFLTVGLLFFTLNFTRSNLDKAFL